MKRSAGIRRLRLAVILVLIILAAIAGTLALTSRNGFPKWAVDEIAKRVSPRGFYLKAGYIRMTPGPGFVIRNVELYRIGVVGPPALEANEINLDWSPSLYVGGRWCVPEMRVSRASIRPVQSFPPESGPPPEKEPDIEMKLFLEDCDVQGLPVERASVNISSDGFKLLFDSAEGVVGSESSRGVGAAQVECDILANTVKGRVRMSVMPSDLTEFLGSLGMTGAVAFCQRFDFDRTPPSIDARFHALARTNWFVRLNGKFRLEDCSYNQVGLQLGDGDLNCFFSETNSIVGLPEFLVVRPEGFAGGSAEINLESDMADFEAVSMMSPPALFQLVGIQTNELFENLGFGGQVRIEADGRADYGNLLDTDISGSCRAFDMTVLLAEVARCRFDFNINGPAVTATNLNAVVYDGRLTGSARVILPYGSTTNASYFLDLAVQDSDFERVAEVTMPGAGDKEYEGTFSGDIVLEGIAGDGMGKTARGKGSLRVKDGRVFMLPVFGGFSSQMASIIPGLDLVLRQSHAKISFDVEKGKVISNEINILGDILSITAQGEYGFDETLDFLVQVRLTKDKTLLDKVIRAATSLVSKLFEFRLRGTLDEPKWEPFGFLHGKPG